MDDDPFKRLVAARMRRPEAEFSRVAEDQALKALAAIPFCADLVPRLRAAFGPAFAHHRFYRWAAQPEDLHLAWDVERPVALQIDPLCEVICAVDREFGAWPPDHDAVGALIEGLLAAR